MDRRSKHALASQRSIRSHVASHAGSRVGSRYGSIVSGVSSRFMHSRQSYVGSKSNLLSSSKKSLTSDSMRFQKPTAKVLDSDGVDVTPRSLLQTEGIHPRKKVHLVGSDAHQPSDTAVAYSIYGTMGGFTMAGGTTLATNQQPFTKSVFAGSVIDLAETEVEDLLRKPSDHPMETFRYVSDIFSDKTIGSLTEEDLEKEVQVTLSETETMWMLDIPGTCVSVDDEEAEEVNKNNTKYTELAKLRPGNDRYTEREMQTIDYAQKVKSVQTEPVIRHETGVDVSTWDMHDTYEELEQAENDKGNAKDGTLEDISSRATSRMTSKTTSRVTSRAPTAMSIPTTIASEAHGTHTLTGTVLNSSILTDLAIQTPSFMAANECERVDPSQPNDHPILKLDALKDSLRMMERAVTLNNFQQKQASYRGLPVMYGPGHQLSVVESIVIQAPHLEKLWTYNCPLTKRTTVTCLAWNPVNKDVVAVGYGSFTTKTQTQGLICCWSLKNPEYPERIFHVPAGVTSLGFSNLHPNLLAVGLFNGIVCVYNARSVAREPVLTSRESLHKHSAPVWQTSWVIKEHYMGENRAEVLVTGSIDGKILQWSVRKGFESMQLMKLKRMVTPKPNEKKSSKSKHAHRAGSKVKPGASAGQGEAYISQHAPGMGFDFSTKDPNIYLACTEEGFIHKCSCSYNEQVLETYSGHNGPVYRVRWSPFVSDIFLTCSSDWTLKLWHQDHTSPLHSFGNSQKSVYDLCWSPFHSAMFGCVSEGQIEIWCLEHNMLDPLITHRPISGANQTCIAFAHTSQVVLVGDSEGTVSVYLMKNVPPPPVNQERTLWNAIQTKNLPSPQ